MHPIKSEVHKDKMTVVGDQLDSLQ